VEEWDPSLQVWHSLGVGEVTAPRLEAPPAPPVAPVIQPEARPDPTSVRVSIAGTELG